MGIEERCALLYHVTLNWTIDARDGARGTKGTKVGRTRESGGAERIRESEKERGERRERGERWRDRDCRERREGIWGLSSR